MEEFGKLKEQKGKSDLEDALKKFNKTKQERINQRRGRIAAKIIEKRKAEGKSEETFGSDSSTEFIPTSKDTRSNEASVVAEKIKISETKDDDEEKQAMVDHLDLQIQESRKQLDQMILDGEVLITNVLVAAEYREKRRQKEQEESKKERLAKLRQEAEESQGLYEQLYKNWEMKAEKVLPMELYKQMKAQHESCEELVTKKDDLIRFMRSKMDENDYEYESSLENYQKDTMLMGDRIDDLMDELRMSFIEELNLIEEYTNRTRESVLKQFHEEWLEQLEVFKKIEEKNVEDRKHDALSKFQNLNDIFITTRQEARETRHKLENDARTLHQEHEQLKFATHLNMEKMAYNLHILQCRAKENAALKNMSKRILLRLHDKFNYRAGSLKKKMELGRKYVEKLAKEIQRLEARVDKFGQKTLQLALSDHKRYRDLWNTHEDTIREKATDLIASDKFIYETQLGIEYPIPEFTIFFGKRPQASNPIDTSIVRGTDAKLDLMAYPDSSQVSTYWEGIMVYLKPKGKDVWATVQKCFEDYSKLLKARNDNVEAIVKYQQQNYELTHLLRKHFEAFAARSRDHPPTGNLNPRFLDYC